MTADNDPTVRALSLSELYATILSWPIETASELAAADPEHDEQPTQ